MMITVTQKIVVHFAWQLGTALLCTAYLAFLTLALLINLAALVIDETLRKISNNYAQRHKDDCYDI